MPGRGQHAWGSLLPGHEISFTFAHRFGTYRSNRQKSIFVTAGCCICSWGLRIWPHYVRIRVTAHPGKDSPLNRQNQCILRFMIFLWMGFCRISRKGTLPASQKSRGPSIILMHALAENRGRPMTKISVTKLTRPWQPDFFVWQDL